MTEISVKDRLRRAVEDLPADASFEDAMERLFVRYRVEQGRRLARFSYGCVAHGR